MSGRWILHGPEGGIITSMDEAEDPFGSYIHELAHKCGDGFLVTYQIEQTHSNRAVARNGEDWWTAEEAENGYVPNEAEWLE